jgi:hypothetical protein
MNRKYITGWFSPNDLDLMVVFYESHLSSPPTYEAELVRRGGVIETIRDTNLGRLQSNVTQKCGGDTKPAHVHTDPRVRSVPASPWLSRFRRPRQLSAVDRMA